MSKHSWTINSTEVDNEDNSVILAYFISELFAVDRAFTHHLPIRS